MNASQWFNEQVRNLQNDPEYLTERLVLDVNEGLCRLMEESNLNRAELARRLGVRRQFISKLLNGNQNLTLLTLVKIATALGSKVNVEFCPVTTKSSRWIPAHHLKLVQFYSEPILNKPTATLSGTWESQRELPNMDKLEETGAIGNAA